MFQFLRQLWHRLCARLRFCGGVQYLAGTASLPSPLSPAEEKALLARMAAGEADARDALILHNLRLVVYIAKKFEAPGVSVEDVISIGTIGLIKAVNTFKPDRGSRLATYAAKCVENAILSRMRLWFQTSIPRAEKNRDGVFWHRYPRICISFALLWTAA